MDSVKSFRIGERVVWDREAFGDPAHFPEHLTSQLYGEGPFTVKSTEPVSTSPKLTRSAALAGHHQFVHVSGGRSSETLQQSAWSGLYFKHYAGEDLKERHGTELLCRSLPNI